MSEISWKTIRQLVYERANGCCEYCRTCHDNIGQSMEIEHIDPSGGDKLENLCLSCANCNRSKATATSGIDPETGQVVALFNPRQQSWSEHFIWVDDGIRIQGLTPTGRATVSRFKMNRLPILNARKRWHMAGFHPPVD